MLVRSYHEKTQLFVVVFFSFYYGLTCLIIFFSDLACSVAGITSDANVLTNELRLIAQR